MNKHALLWAVILGLLTAPSLSGKTKECYDCHQDAKQTFGAYKYVHIPVKNKDCLACHDSHGFSQKLTLKAHDNSLCKKCHPKFGEGYPPSGSAYVHEPVTKGLCWSCHNPHGSDIPGLIRMVGNELVCFECHGQIKSLKKKPVQHQPFARNECSSCHVSHDSKFPHLQKEQTVKLCETCHNLSEKKYLAKHSVSGIDKIDCTTCHDPHASTLAGLIAETAHLPLVEGMCESCHANLAAGDTTLSGEAKELCTTCHDDIAAKLGMANVHVPAAEGQCLECHSGHNSKREFLLVSPPGQACLECHTEFADTLKLQGVHTALKNGKCSACHDPHGSPNASLVKDSGDNLCLGCHQEIQDTLRTATNPHPAIEERNAWNATSRTTQKRFRFLPRMRGFFACSVMIILPRKPRPIQFICHLCLGNAAHAITLMAPHARQC